MPAVQLDKLRLQSANLVGRFSQPELFRYELLEIFEYYSDRTFRSSPVTLPGKLLTSFNLPERVLWQIERDLEAQIKNYPQADGLELCKLLWKGETSEEKSLAVFILGKVTSTPPEPILDVLHQWYHPEMDPTLQKILFADGLAEMRKDHFDEWLKLIQEWVQSGDPRRIGQAYQALTGLLLEQGEKYLPAISRLIQDTIQHLPASTHPEAIQLFQAMVRTSPVESRYLLRKMIQAAPSGNQIQKRLLRKIIDLFPDLPRSELRTEYLNHYKN
jgi:hypothetical protein